MLIPYEIGVELFLLKGMIFADGSLMTGYDAYKALGVKDIPSVLHFN